MDKLEQRGCEDSVSRFEDNLQSQANTQHPNCIESPCFPSEAFCKLWTEAWHVFGEQPVSPGNDRLTGIHFEQIHARDQGRDYRFMRGRHRHLRDKLFVIGHICQGRCVAARINRQPWLGEITELRYNYYRMEMELEEKPKTMASHVGSSVMGEVLWAHRRTRINQQAQRG